MIGVNASADVRSSDVMSVSSSANFLYIPEINNNLIKSEINKYNNKITKNKTLEEKYIEYKKKKDCEKKN
jgi:hypothetical protein